MIVYIFQCVRIQELGSRLSLTISSTRAFILRSTVLNPEEHMTKPPGLQYPYDRSPDDIRHIQSTRVHRNNASSLILDLSNGQISN